MPLTPGQLLNNRYRIDALLGQGGMGAVYDGWDNNLGIRCAIKENQLVTEAAVRQFQREARLLATLRHSNLPNVIDHFFIAGQGQYLVMSFIEGEDLAARLKRLGPQPEADVQRWADDVLGALAYLHKRGIIHRDIKPNNIKITPEGEAVLVDFGIAKEIDEGGGLTTTGARGLTPGFAPPEQYGTGRTDIRSDIYAFGATLYALLAGESPADAWSRMTKPEKYVPLARHAIKVSMSLAQAIDKALELEPENRFQSAEEMKAAVKVSSAAPMVVHHAPQIAMVTPAEDTPTLVEARPDGRPGRLAFLLLGVGTVGAIAVAGFFVFMAFGRGASPVMTDTAEPTATEKVAAPTVRATNTVAPSKTLVPPTATQAQTAIPPTNIVTSRPMVTNTNTAAPATNTRVAVKTPLPTQVVTQQPSPTASGTTDSISNVQVIAEGDNFVTISMNYTLVSAQTGSISAFVSGVKADDPSQGAQSESARVNVNKGSGVVELTLRSTGCPRPRFQSRTIIVQMHWVALRSESTPQQKVPYDKIWSGC